MATINAGRVTFISKGEYNNATQYYKFDLVNYNGGSYIAKGNTLGNLPTNETYWQLIAEKGQTGQTGATGNGISTIQKTSTSGLVDTYTITYTNGTTSTFNITNGEDGEVTQAEFDYYKTIYNAMPKLTGTGTDITIDDTADSILKMDLSGNTYQESTTGANILIPLQQEGYTETKRGITVTVKENGEISLSGTSTNNVGFELHKINLENGKSYYANIFNNLFGSNNVYLQMVDANYAFLKNFFNSTSAYTANADYTDAKVYIYVPTGVTINTTIKPMMTEGSQATEYEPYTGGQASPNPDYPQDIEVVTGDNEIVVGNKNLWSTAIVSYNAPGETPVVGVGYTRSKNYVSVKPNTQYIFSSKNNNVSFRGNLMFQDKNKNTISQLFTFDTAFTTPENCCYIRVVGSDTNMPVGSELQLEYGSTATSYVEHKEQRYPINLGDIELCKIPNTDYKDSFRQSTGKNLLKIESITPYIFDYGLPGVETDILVIDNYSSNSMTFHSSTSNYVEALTNIIQLKPDTQYTIKFGRTTTSTNNQFFIYDYDNGIYSINYRDNNTNVYEKTFTTNSVGKIAFAFGYANASGSTTISSIQLEEGSTATEYEPYGVGTWYKHAEIGKVVLDGSDDEGWTFYNSNSNRTAAYITLSNIKDYGYDEAAFAPKVLVNYFQKVSQNATWYSGQISRRYQDSGLVYFCYDVSLQDIDDVKNWMSSHITDLYYQLATPTNTEITDTNLISQLNTLKYALAYKEQTNISQTNDEQPFIIDYETLYDMQNLVGA